MGRGEGEKSPKKKKLTRRKVKKETSEPKLSGINLIVQGR